MTARLPEPRPRPRAALALTVALIGPLLGLTGCSTVVQGSEPWTPPSYWEDERFATIDGLEICYLEAGPPRDQPGVETIVFVHGWSGNVQNWWDQFEHFSRDYHVIVFDAPGHGKSERGEHVDYSMALYVEVLEGMFEHLELDHAILAGNSAGGWVATKFALAHPERVDALILADATGTRYTGSVGAVLPFINARWLQLSNMTTGEHYPGADPKSQARQEFAASFENTVEEAPYLEALATLLSLSYERIAVEELARIDEPTLVLWGDDDPVIPVKAMTVFERTIADSQSYVVHLGGHSPMMNSPDEFNCAMRTFLEGGDLAQCKQYALTIEKRRDRLAGRDWGPRYE
ncbi:alpha/beta hydrolase [Pseudenhygromyxa sp. WMMC2535]|uniref:alpha/beta fold hydrolase n=1 Tax=Pseudenhygromyxa sp. WMMC2535 TaxID=2712867 RepID=UPI00155715EA|nr:alpha/beta hydrolase [Pseudenhygromyxa sp. WMMC2535]NVB37604.1 alpha/beta hydrolase [Pseudenhygromyxa sp. WMMC2535]